MTENRKIASLTPICFPDEAWADANKNNPNKSRAPGETDWTIHHTSGHTEYSAAERVKGDGFTRTVTVVDVKVTATITINTPQWEDRDKATPEEQKKWDDSIKMLEDHEHDHEAIVRQAVPDIEKSINGTSETATGKTPAEALKNATDKAVKSALQKYDNGVSGVQKKSDQLDADTDHGTKPKKQPD